MTRAFTAFTSFHRSFHSENPIAFSHLGKKVKSVKSLIPKGDLGFVGQSIVKKDVYTGCMGQSLSPFSLSQSKSLKPFSLLRVKAQILNVKGVKAMLSKLVKLYLADDPKEPKGAENSKPLVEVQAEPATRATPKPTSATKTTQADKTKPPFSTTMVDPKPNGNTEDWPQ